jgi:hypothetical protein
MQKAFVEKSTTIWVAIIKPQNQIILAMLPNSFMLQFQLHYQPIPSVLCIMGATPHTADDPQQYLTLSNVTTLFKRPGNPTTQALIRHFVLCSFM